MTLKVPEPDRDWQCPKCGVNGSGWTVTYNKNRDVWNLPPMTLHCHWCGYAEDRLASDAP